MAQQITSLAAISGAPTRTVTLAGRDYRVGALRPRDLADLQAFLMRVTPNPKTEARKLIEGLPTELAIAIWDREMAAAPPWPPTLGSAHGNAFLLSPEGMTEAIFVLLRHTVAGFTREQAARIADSIPMEEFNALLDAVKPESAPAIATDEEESGDPKAEIDGQARWKILPTSGSVAS